MELSDATSRKLDEWLAPGTWRTDDALDEERLEGFVHQYARDHGYSLDATALEEEIVSRLQAQGKWSEGLRQVLGERLIAAEKILHMLDDDDEGVSLPL